MEGDTVRIFFIVLNSKFRAQENEQCPHNHATIKVMRIDRNPYTYEAENPPKNETLSQNTARDA